MAQKLIGVVVSAADSPGVLAVSRRSRREGLTVSRTVEGRGLLHRVLDGRDARPAVGGLPLGKHSRTAARYRTECRGVQLGGE